LSVVFYNIKKIIICGIFYNIPASLYYSVFITLTAIILSILIMNIRWNVTLKQQRRQCNASQGQTIEKLQSKRDQQVLIMLFIKMLFYDITILPLVAVYFYNIVTQISQSFMINRKKKNSKVKLKYSYI